MSQMLRFSEAEFSKQKLNEKSKNELIELILRQQDIQIPVSIFENDVAPLGAVVLYLKNHEGLTIKEISQRLNRNDKTIWTTYNNVKYYELKVTKSNYSIPLRVFSKINLSILETAVYYLKNTYDLSFIKISVLMNRNNKTIWTCYNRYLQKIKLQKMEENTKNGRKK